MVRQESAQQKPADPLTTPRGVDGEVRHVDLVGDRPQAQIADHRAAAPASPDRSPRATQSPATRFRSSSWRNAWRDQGVWKEARSICEHRLEVGGPHRLNPDVRHAVVAHARAPLPRGADRAGTRRPGPTASPRASAQPPSSPTVTAEGQAQVGRRQAGRVSEDLAEDRAEGPDPVPQEDERPLQSWREAPPPGSRAPRRAGPPGARAARRASGRAPRTPRSSSRRGWDRRDRRRTAAARRARRASGRPRPACRWRRPGP